MSEKNTSAPKSNGAPPELSERQLDDGSVEVTGLTFDDGEQHEQEAGGQGASAPGEAGDDQERGAVRSADEGGDAELNAARTDEEREAIRARRRQERQERRQRRIERDRELQDKLAARDQELASLRQIVGTLLNKTVGTELAQIDNELAQANEAVSELRSLISEGTKQQNGEVVAEATDRLARVHNRIQQLTTQRATYAENARRAVQQQTKVNPNSAGVNPKVVSQAQKWLKDNPWYSHEGSDVDSRITKALDDAVQAEGYDPATPDYWDELNERISQYLPHRAISRRSNNNGDPLSSDSDSGYNGAGQRSVQRSAAVAGSGRERGGSTAGATRKSYTLSPERVKALKDAGIWDDPAARQDAIRRYRDYDAQQARGSR